MSKYLIKNRNLGIKRCFGSGLHVNFLQLISIKTAGTGAYSLFSGLSALHKRVKKLPTATKEEFYYQRHFYF